VEQELLAKDILAEKVLHILLVALLAVVVAEQPLQVQLQVPVKLLVEMEVLVLNLQLVVLLFSMLAAAAAPVLVALLVQAEVAAVDQLQHMLQVPDLV
jgi:hypothetical protein